MSTLDGPAPPGDRPRRVPAGMVAAAVAVLLGVGGLVAGARTPAPDTGSGSGAAAAPAAPGTAVGALTVVDAYIRQPSRPDVASAYLTVRNESAEADRLSSAYCGAAARTTVHGESAAMEDGGTAPAAPVPVPGSGVVTLSPRKGHIMLDGLTGTLRAGDTVSLLLRFDRAGQVLLDVPVIAADAPAPGGTS